MKGLQLVIGDEKNSISYEFTLIYLRLKVLHIVEMTWTSINKGT